MQRTGTYDHTAASGVYTIGFRAVTSGTYGNLLDNIQIDLTPYVEFFPPATTQPESVSNATLLPQLRVSGLIAAPVVVNVTVTGGGDAVLGTDFDTPSGTNTFQVTIPAENYDGTQTIPLGLTILNDNLINGSRTIELSMAPDAANYTIASTQVCGGVANDTMMHTILDDDARIRLSKALSTTRYDANDQFQLSIAPPVGPASVVTTTGGDPVATGTVDVQNITTGSVYTLSETEVPAGPVDKYGSTWACTNARPGGVPSSGAGKSFTLTPQVADDISCTFTNAALSPSLTIQKNQSSGHSPATVGDVIGYEILVTNTGTQGLSNVTLTDLLSTGPALVPVLASGDTNANSVLDVGEIWRYTVDNTVTLADVTATVELENTATVTTTQTPPQSSVVKTPLSTTPIPSIVKTQAGGPSPVTAAGQVIDYEIRVGNVGNVGLTNVQVLDTFPNGTSQAPTYVSGDSNSNQVLDTNETWTYTISYTVSQPDMDPGVALVNTARVVTTETPTPRFDTETTPLTTSPALAIVKTGALQDDGNGVMNAGDELIYTFTVTNTGNVQLIDVAPSDPGPTFNGAAADIKVTYDGLDGARRLQAGLISAEARADQVNVVLGLDTNYGAWIDRAEFRLFVAGESKPIAVIPTNGWTVSWIIPAGVTGDVHYVARVYDAQGRYDETQFSTLSVTELREAGAVGPNVVSGGDTTAMRSIPVYGGTVTVSGASIPPGTALSVMGETVTTDAEGRFVLDRILPTGDHVVDIAMAQPDGKLVTFRRDVNIPTDDWFYVGLADLTVGTKWGDGGLTDARPEEFDTVYYKGRAAFYLKGKIRGEYLLTAAADSGEGPLSEMLTGVLSTDPQAVLRRIDPSQYYPVYGDDSQPVDDAPTSGKLYVRLERGPSHVMWGNFRTTIGDASILRTQRSLYGASAHLETDAVTARGDAVAKGSAYLAQPQTVAARDVLRGTGGSAYVLRRQDTVPGSEIITIEVVNAITGTVIQTRRLRPGVDYTINYMQGLVILAQPLSSSRLGTGAVQSSQPDVVNLAVQYEYRPTGEQMSDYAFGASGSTWLGDHLRVGAVALSETSSKGEDLTVIGVNARLQADEASFIEAEILRSQGQGQAEWMSIDGGFTFVQQPVLAAAREAYAYRVSAGVDLSKLIDESFAATAGVTVEGREKGFSTTSQQTLQDTLSASAFLDVSLNEDVDLGLKIDHIENAGGARRSEIGAELQYALGADLVVTAGLVHRDTFHPGGTATQNGNRTDLGVRVSYQALDDLTLHAFGQVTAYTSPGYHRNDRVGLGAEWQINEQWSLGAEGSIGSSGPQVVAMATHSAAPGERTYLGVRLAPDGSDDFFTRTRSINGLVAGGSRRLNEAVSVFAENTYGLFNDAGRLNALYGVNFTPDQLWSANLTYETGTIQHDLAGQLDRHALSAALAFKDDGIEWSNRAELRLEQSADGSKDRTTMLGKSAVSVETSEDWRMMGGISALISQSDQSSILDGDYIEANIGAAYRPTTNDRLNALIRYSYLYDLPGPQQVTSNNSVMGPALRSHVFSVDANYDLTEYFTLGGKYGFRIGEVSTSRAADKFIFSSAHLFILRADMTVATDWHLLGEIRGLFQPETSAFSPGGLAMVSYDVNDTVRAGVGYNVGGYSDDLRDLSFDKHGLFFNLAARF